MYTLTTEEQNLLLSVKSFDALAEIALSSLVRMRGEHLTIVQICGPMSTGGLGNLAANMDRFNRAINVAVSRDVSVFNQIHFQEAMIRICKWEESQPYPMDLLERFYGRIFSAGHIDKGLFLPDWRSSIGARWEWDEFQKLQIPVEDYPEDWLQEILLDQVTAQK